jgi:ElaB/YqjD/DUF883 family membrane-anchored ribosome-binding protein
MSVTGRRSGTTGRAAQPRKTTMSNSIDYEADHLAQKVSDTAHATGGAAQRRIAEAANQVSEAASHASAQAKNLYGEVSGRARKIAETVDPYVKDKPYATMGMVAVAGLLFGLIVAGRGPKVIYVEPKG